MDTNCSKTNCTKNIAQKCSKDIAQNQIAAKTLPKNKFYNTNTPKINFTIQIGLKHIMGEFYDTNRSKIQCGRRFIQK